MDVFEKVKHFTRAKEAQQAGHYPYFKPLQSGAGATVILDGRQMIMIGSNNYLGLTQDPRVKEAAIRAVEKYGSGCSGSRFLNGTLEMHEELEDRLASFLGKEKAVVFSTGFQTNQGIISTIVGKGDVVLSDRNNHASIVDGCRLSFGRAIKFPHGDMEELERLLIEHAAKAGVMIVVDGIFSMEGKLADLPPIAALRRKFSVRLMVDDAHGIGVMGASGRGTAEHFGVERDVDLVMGTFSKSFSSLGGFVAGPEPVIHFIKHLARSLIFSASIPPPNAAAALAALDIIETEPERRRRLWEITERVRSTFDAMGLDTGDSQSPVIPIVFDDEDRMFRFYWALYEGGLFTNPVIHPAVEKDRPLIRTSYMATHTDEQIDQVLGVVGSVARELGFRAGPRSERVAPLIASQRAKKSG